MSGFLYNLLIVLAWAMVLLIVTLVAYKILIDWQIKQILQNGRQREDCAYRLLALRFGTSSLLRHILLPIQPVAGSQYCDFDLLMVGRGGILVITLKGQTGFIENPMRGDWRAFTRTQTQQFANPFELNALRVAAVRNILAEEQFTNVPVHSIVAFMRPVKFKNRFSQVVTAEQLIPSVVNLNKNRFLTGEEIRNVTRLLRKYARKRPPRNPAAPAPSPSVPQRMPGSAHR